MICLLVPCGSVKTIFSVLVCPVEKIKLCPAGDALIALKGNVGDPGNVLQSWDSTLPNPCTWFHITCNEDSRVTRV